MRNTKFNRLISKNNTVLSNELNLRLAKKNRVNLNAWINYESEVNNVGDYLSLEIVKYVCLYKGLDFDKSIVKTKHLYGIGSILLGWQDVTVWGSGFGYDFSYKWYFNFEGFLHRILHKTDIRAVRGPLTRQILNKMGIKCPEIYGDPGVLLPLFYQPIKSKNREMEYILIPHYSKLGEYKGEEILGSFQKDWRAFIDKIVNSKLVVSSSLHGIIIAEAYGIPALMWYDTPANDLTKYKDWYLSTRRKSLPIVYSIEEALEIRKEPLDLQIIKEMQDRLLDSFPTDLWK